MKQTMFCRGMCLLTLSAFFSAPAVAAECSVSSGSQSVALLELYSSEGCSSCPPADRWLSKLSAHGFSTDRVIPLALHVDYWDYIGWKDRFAMAAETCAEAGLEGHGHGCRGLRAKPRRWPSVAGSSA